MALELGNPWTMIAAFSISVIGLFVCWSRKELMDRIRGVCANPGPRLVAIWRQFRWLIIGPMLIFAFAVGLVGWRYHNTFFSVELSEKIIRLEYPWPRSDVSLQLGDVIQAEVESRRSRLRYLFRLRIVTKAGPYVSLWTGEKEALDAQAAIAKQIAQ
jgi:hypothetical protein